MKKILCILTAISLLIINTTSAFAHSLFDKRWNQGEYIIELTDEEIARYSAIFETALKNRKERRQDKHLMKYNADVQMVAEQAAMKALQMLVTMPNLDNFIFSFSNRCKGAETIWRLSIDSK